MVLSRCNLFFVLLGASFYIPQGAGSGPQNLVAPQSVHSLTTTSSFIASNLVSVSNTDSIAKPTTSKNIACIFVLYAYVIKRICPHPI